AGGDRSTAGSGLRRLAAGAGGGTGTAGGGGGGGQRHRGSDRAQRRQRVARDSIGILCARVETRLRDAGRRGGAIAVMTRAEALKALEEYRVVIDALDRR